MPFDDPYDFVAIPRVSGLWLAPDGTRLVTSVSALSADRKRWVSSLWEIDPEGEAQPWRLTRSAPGEAAPAFLPDGSVVFASRRPDPDDAETGDDTHNGSGNVAALWLLPAAGGEARRIAGLPGGVEAVAVAAESGTIALRSPVMPGAASGEDDERRRKARSEAGVTALLHESYPVRHWDHDLGPAQSRLFVTDPPETAEGVSGQPRDLTPDPGRALDERDFEVTPGGQAVVSDWYVSPGGARGTPFGDRDRRHRVGGAASAGRRRRPRLHEPHCLPGRGAGGVRTDAPVPLPRAGGRDAVADGAGRYGRSRPHPRAGSLAQRARVVAG